jgi:hypothetical protein
MWKQLHAHFNTSYFGIASLSCGVCLVLAAAGCNNPPGPGTNAGGVTNRQGGGGGGAGPGPGIGMSLDGPNPCLAASEASPAPPVGVAGMPQYCIGDAQIFAGTAASTARVIIQEQQLTVEDPKVIGNQAAFLAAATDRSLEDARALERYALDMNGPAVAPIKSAIAKLEAAQALTNELQRFAQGGQLEPSYPVTVKEALGDLDAASGTLSSIAHKYPGSAARGGKPAGPPARSTGAAQRQR